MNKNILRNGKNQRRKGREFFPVSLKSIIPIIPVKDEEKLHLVEDVTKMGCEGLILEPWTLKSETMVQEF